MCGAVQAVCEGSSVHSCLFLPSSPSLCSVKRVWLPNVQRKKLWSDILQRPIDINVTTHALRQIDRVGGVDNYLLHTPSVKLASETGDRLRKLLQDKAKFNAKKERLSKPATSTAQEGGAAQLS